MLVFTSLTGYHTLLHKQKGMFNSLLSSYLQVFTTGKSDTSYVMCMKGEIVHDLVMVLAHGASGWGVGESGWMTTVCGGKYEFEWITYTLWYVIIVIKSVPQAVTNPLEVYRLRKSSVGVMSLRKCTHCTENTNIHFILGICAILNASLYVSFLFMEHCYVRSVHMCWRVGVV